MKLTILLADANGRVTEHSSKIENATRQAEIFMNQKFHLDHNVNLVFSSMNMFLIPEDGIGGRTYWYDFILITIDPKKSPSGDALFEIICHEVAHAIRWSKNAERADTLFANIINEGLATMCEWVAVYENDIKNRQIFINTIVNRPDIENERIFAVLKQKFNDSYYNYDELFFYGNNDLPRWAGYSVGYYLVKKYVKVTKKNIWDVVFDNYYDFSEILL